MTHKKCNKCGQEKPLDEFHRAKNSADGYRNDCGECHNEMTRAWRRSNRERVAEYNRLWREANSEYGYDWKKSNPKKVARHRAKYPERIAARAAVQHAIRDGRMQKACDVSCIKCGDQAKEYHHHKGYEKEHWLDVIPVCKTCHVGLDKKKN